MSSVWSSRPITAAEAAILHHPDRQTAWAPLLVVEVDGAALDVASLSAAVGTLAEQYSILRATLRGHDWVATEIPPALVVVEPAGLAAFCRPFDLTQAPPLRVGLSADGRRLSLTAHHAALDGRALLAVAEQLLSAQEASAAERPGLATEPTVGAPRATAPEAGGASRALRRLAFPADRVAPSAAAPASEVFVSAELPPNAPARVANLAAAAAASAGAWNAARGAPWSRIGLTIPVGGPPVLGNVSTHRRVDLAAGEDVIAAVNAALAERPPDGGGSPSPAVMRLLAPVVQRFSDSLLVSNLGLVTLPGATAIDFYPQARGRSAVALGAASVDGGARRLTLRARDLNRTDAQALLDATVTRLA